MSNQQGKPFPSAFLAQLMSGALGTDIKIHTVQLDPDRDLDEQLAEIAETAAAAHRAVCSNCAAHKAAQAAQTAAQRPETDAGNATVGDTDMAATKATAGATEAKTPARERVVVGYMAFDGNKPIHGTFEQERRIVDQGIQQFRDEPIARVLPKGALASLHIRPVYAD